MGCLFAMFAGLFPRLALFMCGSQCTGAGRRRHGSGRSSASSPPFTTLMYVILYRPGGLVEFDWFWIRPGGLLRPRALGHHLLPAPPGAGVPIGRRCLRSAS